MAQDALYQAFVELVPTGKGFDKAVASQVGDAGAKGQTAFAGAFGKGLGLKLAGVVGVAFSALQVGDLISDAITNAADRENAWGAVEQVFGERGASAIAAFSESAAKEIGQSSTAVFDAAKDIGVFGKAAGLADRELADFSTGLITLGADFAAFGNTSPEEAVTALSAALRGESEPIRKYGILLDDATLKARALAMGIYSGKGSLTQQQRILAANEEIIDQAAKANITDQFQREADSLIGMQTTLQARMEDLSADAGEALLPLAEKLVEWVSTEGTERLEGFVDWLTDPATEQGISDFADRIVELVDELAAALDAVMKVVDGIATAVQWIDQIDPLSNPDFQNEMNSGVLKYGGVDQARAFWEAQSSMLGSGSRGREGGGGISVIINPQKGQSEEEIGNVAINRLEQRLRASK